MSAHPFFSILVPTYNHAKYVGAALDSLLAQTDADWEAVVVNDGSTDNTADVLNRYAQRDPRIRAFHKANGGTGSALNRALSEARGDWICWLSSDDFFDAKKLAIHRDWIKRDPACRFHFTYFRLFNQAAGTTVDHQLWGPLPDREFQVLGLFYRNFISGISICIHRESWERVGRFNERLRYAQDYDMWLRLLARFPATFIPEWTCINRHHSGQYSEIFPQACYYDTAAAGVQFLNDHRFEQMFPLLDLRDPKCALRAVERALTQAADDTAFLYWYGAHPNLLARTLEWAWDRSLGIEVHQQRAPCRQLAGQMIADTARSLRGTSLGWHWQIASAATALPNPDFTFTPMPPQEVGLAFLHDLRAQGKTDLPDLQRYFKMQYGIDLPIAPPNLGRRTVVVAHSQPSPTGMTHSSELSQAARQLHMAGCKVLEVRVGANRLGHVDGMPFIEADTPRTFDSVLRDVLPADAVVWDQPAKDASGFPCKQHLVAPDFRGDLLSLVQRVVAPPPLAKPRWVPLRPTPPADRRKVVFIGRSPWGGGAERVTYDLLHGLDPQKYELHFIHLFRNQGRQIDFDPTITVHDVEHLMMQRPSDRAPLWQRAVGRARRIVSRVTNSLVRLTQASRTNDDCGPFMDSIRQLWPRVIALRDILHRIGPDALPVSVMEEATVCLWLTQAFAEYPYCASLHTAESYNLPLMYPDANRLVIERLMFANACRNAAVVTMPSQGCKHDLTVNFNVPNRLVEVVRNPIDLTTVLPNCVDSPEVPIPKLAGRSLFVHIARLSVEKNHQLLLDACRLLRQRHPNFLVVCLGDGPLRNELQQRIQELGLKEHVSLLGEVNNPFAYLARSQGLVLTSSFESFALVLIEALACGTVPIATDCPFGPREVLDHGNFGLLVPMNNPAALADAMYRVVNESTLREKHRRTGLQRARAYDLPGVVSQWEQVIDRLSGQPPELMASLDSAA